MAGPEQDMHMERVVSPGPAVVIIKENRGSEEAFERMLEAVEWTMKEGGLVTYQDRDDLDHVYLEEGIKRILVVINFSPFSINKANSLLSRLYHRGPDMELLVYDHSSGEYLVPEITKGELVYVVYGEEEEE